VAATLAGGEAALASKGPGGAACLLSGAQPSRLRAALEGARPPGGGTRISGGRWLGSLGALLVAAGLGPPAEHGRFRAGFYPQ
jgi:hypothetical protein